MANVNLDKHVIAAFSKPPFRTEKPFTAVVKTRYFAGSFDFATFADARDYLEYQARKGVVAYDSVTDSVRFNGSFVIDRNTFEVWSLADLDIAYPRSNAWRTSRVVCMSAAEHAARIERINAYLAARKARIAAPAEKPQTVAVHMLDSDTVRHVPAVKPTDDNFGAFAAFGFPETLVPGPDALPGYRVATCEKGFHHGAEFMAMPDDDPRDFHQYEMDMRALGSTLARDAQEGATATLTPNNHETRAGGQASPVSVDYSGGVKSVRILVAANAYACIAHVAGQTDIRLSPGKSAQVSLREYATDTRQRADDMLRKAALAENAAAWLDSNTSGKR